MRPESTQNIEVSSDRLFVDVLETQGNNAALTILMSCLLSEY